MRPLHEPPAVTVEEIDGRCRDAEAQVQRPPPQLYFHCLSTHITHCRDLVSGFVASRCRLCANHVLVPCSVSSSMDFYSTLCEPGNGP